MDGVREEWARLERPGAPKLICASYFTFGGDEEAAVRTANQRAEAVALAAWLDALAER